MARVRKKVYNLFMFEFLAIVFIVAGLSVLIIIHELGHFFTAKYFGLLVEEFGFGLPPRAGGRHWGETLVSLNWLPLGGFVKIYGERHDNEKNGIDPSRSFSHLKIWKKAVVIACGVVMNFVLGWMLISLVFMAGIPQSILITEVRENSLAETAGLLPGDQVNSFQRTDDFIDFINQNKGQEAVLKITRAGEGMDIKITPRVIVPEGEGNLGVSIAEAGLPKTGFFRSFWEGLKTAVGVVIAIVLSLGQLIIGIFTDADILNKFVGPVGIVNTAIQTTKLGVVYFLQLLALLSLNLAVFNILPIPALDGGRLLFLLIEKIKGSPIKPYTENLVNGLGFAFLISLILVITAKDIWTLL
ncbi:MAG: RIP metalloprotease RseP [bacterium]|nr:RIP metalloprotease RseP [bacterium]